MKKCLFCGKSTNDFIPELIKNGWIFGYDDKIRLKDLSLLACKKGMDRSTFYRILPKLKKEGKIIIERKKS